MRAVIGVTTGLIVRLAVAVAAAAIATHESDAGPAFTGETGHPSNLINRPACETDDTAKHWSKCAQWPLAGNHSLQRRGP